MSWNDIYKTILRDLYLYGKDVSPRGMKCKELLNYSFTLNNILDNRISLPQFELKRYAEIELEWYKSGSNDINFDPLIKKVWEKYSFNGQHALSGYGKRLMEQWNWIKDELKQDPDSRRAVIMLHDAKDKESMYSRDMPCTLSLQFLVREECLNLIVNMRSNDVVYGSKNDVFCFTSLQKQMADELGLKYGSYYHNAGSMHLYEKDWEKVSILLGGI